MSSPAYVSDFLFYGNGLLVLVCLRLARRLFRATLAEISAEYADAIAGLCTVPCGGPVSRELWLYSRHGALRFFRVGENGSLEEIDRDGVPFVDGKPVGTMRAGSGRCRISGTASGCRRSRGFRRHRSSRSYSPLADETECDERSGCGRRQAQPVYRRKYRLLKSLPAEPGSSPIPVKRGEGQGGEVNGGDFSLRLPIFPALLTLFR